MNKFIEKELNNCRSAVPEKVTETQYIIHKLDDLTPQVGGSYIIELANYITHPSENFTLASNWNRGIVPKSNCLKCVITQIMGKMIKVDGIGYNGEDLKDSYVGLWLPVGGIKIIKKLS